MLEFSNVYPSILNWAIVGLMAATFILFLKFILARFNVPHVSPLVGSL